MTTEPAASAERATELARLQRLLDEREKLAALVGHELRNPLHGLTLQLALARVTAQARGQVESEAQVAKAQAMLARYVSRVTVLLDLVRLGGSELPLARRRFDLAALVAAGIDALGPEAAHWGVALAWVAPPAPVPVDTDAMMVEQILENLLLNAFKHARCTRVVVRLRRVGGRALLSVADDGHGIEPALRSRLFERGARAAPGAGGSGLGLWIVRKLAASLGGEVRLRTTPGAGSVFTLRLPLAPAAQATP
jgi:signal transduction histidine kinase